MEKSSTRLSLITHLYGNSEEHAPSVITEQPHLQQEWESLKVAKEAIDNAPLFSPSETSVQLVLAYALGKEEIAPSC
jgi:hypothetical protein